MLSEQFKDDFMKGYDCSQVVLRHYAQEYGLTHEQANKLAACFGGGMMMGSTCGAYVGACMVIGLKYGHFDPDNLMPQKEIMMAKYGEFKQKFVEQFGSTECIDLLGFDVSTPEGFQGALDSGKLFRECPCLAAKVIEILDEVL